MLAPGTPVGPDELISVIRVDQFRGRFLDHGRGGVINDGTFDPFGVHLLQILGDGSGAGVHV
jgi:hypothetical protein